MPSVLQEPEQALLDQISCAPVSSWLACAGIVSERWLRLQARLCEACLYAEVLIFSQDRAQSADTEAETETGREH